MTVCCPHCRKFFNLSVKITPTLEEQPIVPAANPKPTENQLNCIHIICENLDLTFEGQTKREASTFISEHIQASREASRNNWDGFEEDCDPTSFPLYNQIED